MHDFLRERRSIRRFKAEAVSRAAIERMLTTASHAPSAHNRQPWRFAVIEEAEPKRRLAEAMATEFALDLSQDGVAHEEVQARVDKSRDRILCSPLIIALCLDMSEMDHYPDARRAEAERIMAVQSVAAAGSQLLLAAQAEGLAGVWTCSPLFAPQAVRQSLRLPEAWEPQALFFIGHAGQPARSKTLKPLAEVVRFIES